LLHTYEEERYDLPHYPRINPTPKKSKKKRHYCTVSVDVTNHDAQIHEMYSNKIQKWTATYVVPCTVSVDVTNHDAQIHEMYTHTQFLSHIFQSL
jgi:ribulose 1,5-bisphosphate synthetase/thiazole synthase